MKCKRSTGLGEVTFLAQTLHGSKRSIGMGLFTCYIIGLGSEWNAKEILVQEFVRGKKEKNWPGTSNLGTTKHINGKGCNRNNGLGLLTWATYLAWNASDVLV